MLFLLLIIQISPSTQELVFFHWPEVHRTQEFHSFCQGHSVVGGCVTKKMSLDVVTSNTSSQWCGSYTNNYPKTS